MFHKVLDILTSFKYTVSGLLMHLDNIQVELLELGIVNIAKNDFIKTTIRRIDLDKKKMGFKRKTMSYTL